MAKQKKELCNTDELLVGLHDPSTSVLKTVIVCIVFHVLYLIAPLGVTFGPVVIMYYSTSYRYVALLFMVTYWSYVFLDKSYKNLGNPWKAAENNFLVRYLLGWLPIKLLRTTKLNPDKLYIFACHPHGTLAFNRAAVGFSTETLWDLAFPNITFRVLTATPPFFVPFIREFWLWSYCIDASKSTAVKAIRQLRASLFVYPGGELEQIETVYQQHIAMLSMRKGFIKLAIEEGAEVVPVYAFGETDLYYHSRFLREFRKYLTRRFHVAVPLLRGQFGLMPFRVPVTMVFGAPIKLVHSSTPTQAEIDHGHKLYCAALLKLFDDYKEKCGYPNATLEIR
jgi:2-acylglycerol O-acyltransferase 2